MLNYLQNVNQTYLGTIMTINKNLGYHHYRLARFFYIIFLVLLTPICFSQQNSTKNQGNLYRLVNNKVDSLLDNDFTLMNARFLINKYPKAKGKPYFETTTDAPGKLIIGKNEYNNIRLIYDIFDQKLNFIIQKTENSGTILELNTQIINRFYLDDKVFVNSYELPILPQSGFYEVIYIGKHLNVYARWGKIYIDRITNEYIGEFSSQKKKLFFEINGKMVDISSRKKFLKIFAGERNRINSFMKESKIRLFKSNNSDLIKLFSYTDSLL